MDHLTIEGFLLEAVRKILQRMKRGCEEPVGLLGLGENG